MRSNTHAALAAALLALAGCATADAARADLAVERPSMSAGLVSADLGEQGRAARVAPGSTFKATVDVALNVEDCPDCAVQVLVGFDHQVRCASDGVASARHGPTPVELRAPSSPGTYEVRWAAVLGSSCVAAQGALRDGFVLGTVTVPAG